MRRVVLVLVALAWVPASCAGTWQGLMWASVEPVTGAIPEEFPVVLAREGVVEVVPYGLALRRCDEGPCEWMVPESLIDEVPEPGSVVPVEGGQRVHAVLAGDDDLRDEGWYVATPDGIRAEHHRMFYGPAFAAAWVVYGALIAVAGEALIAGVAFALSRRRATAPASRS